MSNPAEVAAVNVIIRVLKDKGSHPIYHDQQIKRLRQEWPALAIALNALIKSRGQESLF